MCIRDRAKPEKVTDDDVEQYIQSQLTSSATTTEVTDRAAQKGDTVAVSYTHLDVYKRQEDGKLDLSVREKAFIQMDADAELIVKRMEEHEGKLPFTDKADPEKIKNELGLSKNAFKRAVGRLLKENKVIITEKSIEFLHK